MPTNIPTPTYTAIPAGSFAGQAGYYFWPRTGTVTEYRVGAAWWDYDFVRTSDGRLVVACCPTEPLADYAELRIYQYDDAYPPNATSHVVVETSKVWASTLILRPDGTLDLWYLKSGLWSQPHHRFSRDGGLTWSAAEVHSGGVIDFDDRMEPRSAVPYATSFIAGNRHALPACLLSGQNMLAMVMDGDYVAADAAVYLLTARLKTDGERWEFTGKKKISGGADDPLIGTINHLQAMPDGSIITSPSSGHITKLKADATCTIEYWASPGTGPTSSGSFPRTGQGVRIEADWKTGRRAGYAQWVVNSSEPTYPNKGAISWGQSEFTLGARFVGTGVDFYPGYLTGSSLGTDASYALAIRSRNSARFQDDGRDILANSIPLSKMRPDGRWELLRVNEQSELEFARCSVLPDDNVTTWDGR